MKNVLINDKLHLAKNVKNIKNKIRINLPKDYRDLIITSKGFHSLNIQSFNFHPLDRIDYLRKIEPELLKLWKQEKNVGIGEILEKSIIVNGIRDEQSFSLLPPGYESECNNTQFFSANSKDKKKFTV